jgi:hypothetical protein
MTPTKSPTNAELAEMKRRADIADSTDYVCDEATLADLRRALAEIKRLRTLVFDLYEDSLCTFDHHGYCQEHGWFETEPACPHSRIRAFGLDQDGEESDD